MTNLSFSAIYNELQDKLNHQLLQRSGQQPIIDNDKLMILYSLIKQTSYSEDKKKRYIIATMLVQIALDTHDLVSENMVNDTKQANKDRQLTVLAGDFYSGHYYHILAQIDDVKMIATLASAIKEINELKMSVYYEKDQSLQTYIETIKKLESVLIIRVAEHISKDSINEFAKHWLLTKKLVQEKNLYTASQHAPLFDILLSNTTEQVQKNQVLQAIESIIRKQLLISEELVHSLPSHFQTLRVYVQRFFTDHIQQHKLAMEEG